MNKAKERVIFDNYDLCETFTDEELKEQAIDCEWVNDEEDITDNMLYEWRNESADLWWEDEKAMLEDFFCNKKVIFFGTFGTWRGNYSGARIGDFWELFYKAIKDCDYIKLWDENGKFFIKSSHHDGTNIVEVKVLKDGAEDYYDRWSYGTDNRTEDQVYKQIVKRYSILPHYAKKVFG